MKRYQARSQTCDAAVLVVLAGPGGGQLVEHLAGLDGVGCGVDPPQL
jgi:hypothetical protein